jgi:hypothetical protein
MHAIAAPRPRAESTGPIPAVRAVLAQMVAIAPILTATGLALLATTVPFALLLWLDPRTISGAPAWLKPAKFSLSTGLYALTLAWVFTYLPEWRRTRIAVGGITVAAMGLEVALIAMQAGRGTISHFNASTPFDTIVYNVMGLAIVAQTIASVWVAVAVWRQRFADRALGWALRLGLTLTILGASTGGFMVSPRPVQVRDVDGAGRMTLAGAHSIGGPDGGPGLPMTGWSTQHGDIRVPHFVGLHAWQALPLFALLGLGRLDDRRRLQAVIAAAAVYGLVFALLLAQALGGSPLVALG